MAVIPDSQEVEKIYIFRMFAQAEGMASAYSANIKVMLVDCGRMAISVPTPLVRPPYSFFRPQPQRTDKQIEELKIT